MRREEKQLQASEAQERLEQMITNPNKLPPGR